MMKARSLSTSAARVLVAAASCAIFAAWTHAAETPKGNGSSAVPVYPGATPDAETTKFFKEQLRQNGFAYRTKDNVQKVAEFYGKQPSLKAMGPTTKEGALFKRCKEEYSTVMKKKIATGSCDLDVTLQNPWMDMKTGKLNTDTLITIMYHTAGTTTQ